MEQTTLGIKTILWFGEIVIAVTAFIMLLEHCSEIVGFALDGNIKKFIAISLVLIFSLRYAYFLIVAAIEKKGKK